MDRFVGVLGIAVTIGIVYFLSRERQAIRWRQVAWGLGLQFCLALLILRVPGVHQAFKALAVGVEWFVSFADAGARYVFGSLAEDRIPVTIDGEESGFAHLGSVLIIKILPTLVFFSSAMSVLYHVGIIQWIVTGMAWAVKWFLRVSGAEALASMANVFMGMTEAPLLIRPYLAGMTSSELLTVMVGGFATISGSMMAVYHELFDVDFSFLLAASVLNAPAALYLAKIYLPEKAQPSTLGEVRVQFERETVNVVDAAARGAGIGLRLALNVGAMLLAFAAGLALIDSVLGWAGEFFMPAGEVLSLGRVFGWLFLPFAWLLGVPSQECAAVGELLGLKIALNEYFAYSSLSSMDLSARAKGIAVFALCGFANFGSIAIQLGGIGSLVPERRSELARFGILAMFLGALATCTSAALAGLLLEFE